MKRYSYLSHLECSRCHTEYEAAEIHNTCECGSPLLARYDLSSLAKAFTPSDLANREHSMWRYHELLPVTDPSHVVSLGEVVTPLLSLPTLGQEMGLSRLRLKDEGMLPTGTFKARGAASGVSRAYELGIKSIAMPTNGNAGAAWAGYAARAGMRALVVMPSDAPDITRRECAISGASLQIVGGSIKDAGRIVARAVTEQGWFDVSTLKEPYRLEGKKTMMLEILEQCGWSIPEVIVYPTGGGVGIIAMYKALRELQEIGWVGDKLPRLVSVQADGCAPIARAFQNGQDESTEWEDPSTIAFGINVPKALGDFLVLEAVTKTGGTAVSVSDEATLRAQRTLALREGIFCCPEGAAAIAATQQLVEEGWIQPEEEVVILNTGTGLKYPETVQLTVARPGSDGVASVKLASA